MLTIRKEKFIGFASDSGRGELSEVAVEIDVDTSDELPAVDGIKGRLLHQGSVARIIKEKRTVVLSGEGKWEEFSVSSGGGSVSGGGTISESEIDDVIEGKIVDGTDEITAEELSYEDIDSIF